MEKLKHTRTKKEKSSKKDDDAKESAKKDNKEPDSKETKTESKETEPKVKEEAKKESETKDSTKEDKDNVSTPKEPKSDTQTTETKDAEATKDKSETKSETTEGTKETSETKDAETTNKNSETKSESKEGTKETTETKETTQVKESKKESSDRGKSKTVKIEKQTSADSPSSTQRKKLAKQRSATLQPMKKNDSINAGTSTTKDTKPAEKKHFNFLGFFKKEPEFQPVNLREVKDRPRGYVGKLHVKIFYGTGLPDDKDGAVYFDDDETLSQIKTGDLIAFCGVSPLSAAIKMKTNTPFSHVAIAARIPDPKSKTKDAPMKLMLFESTNNGHDVPDYMDGTVRRGMTVFEFKHRLHHIDSMAIWHIPLKEPLTKDQSKGMLDWLWTLHKKQIKYDKLQLIPFWFNIGNKEDLREMFCSEMVASALRAAKRLPSNANPSNFSPCGVALSDCFDQDDDKHRILKYEVMSDRRVRFL